MAGQALLVGALAGLSVLCWPGRRRSLRQHARPVRRPPGVRAAVVPGPVLLDLLAAALSAGLSTSGAVTQTLAAAGDAVDDATRRSLQAAAHRTTAASPHTSVTRALALADRTGASAAVLLRAAASDERDARRRRAAVATGRLGVRLVLPLGLTVLPAFVLLGVVPVVVGLAGPVLSGRAAG